jgi:hypothetical protein
MFERILIETQNLHFWLLQIVSLKSFSSSWYLNFTSHRDPFAIWTTVLYGITLMLPITLYNKLRQLIQVPYTIGNWQCVWDYYNFTFHIWSQIMVTVERFWIEFTALFLLLFKTFKITKYLELTTLNLNNYQNYVNFMFLKFRKI